MFAAIALTLISVLMLLLTGFTLWSLIRDDKKGVKVTQDQSTGWFVLMCITFGLMLGSGLLWDEYMDTGISSTECEDVSE